LENPLLAAADLEAFDSLPVLGAVNWRHHFFADGSTMGYEYKKFMGSDEKEYVDVILKGESPYCILGRVVKIDNNPPKFEAFSWLLPYYDEIGRTCYFGTDKNDRLIIIEPNPEYAPELFLGSETNGIPPYVGKRITQGPIPEVTPEAPY